MILVRSKFISRLEAHQLGACLSRNHSHACAKFGQSCDLGGRLVGVSSCDCVCDLLSCILG